jgi:hypothetical protein
MKLTAVNFCDTKITSYLYNPDGPVAPSGSRYPQNRAKFLSLPAQNNMPFYSLNTQNTPENEK